jgi:metal-responsive CopG/Arc/MetJ family transcriptional regulator
MDLTTVRLPESLTRSVDEIAKQRQVSRSEVVREALEQYCERARSAEKLSRVELLHTLVAYPGSGVGDLASRSEQHLRKRFHARRRGSR